MERLSRKVQVVYCLNVEGRIDHPHLIEGAVAADGDGLRLREFKRWLASRRGSSLPDSFSWSCKRKYKGAFVWHDLSDDDLIHPLQSNEYVLMGSEIRPYVRKATLPLSSMASKTVVGVSTANMAEVSSSGAAKTRDLQQKAINKAEGCVTVMGETDEASYAMVPPPISQSTEASDGSAAGRRRQASRHEPQQHEEIRVYSSRAMSMARDQVSDAATQTEDSKRNSMDQGPSTSPLALHLLPPKRSSASSTASPPLTDAAAGSRSLTAEEWTSFCSVSSDAVAYSPTGSTPAYSAVMETVSPGSARSFKSINSVNSSSTGSAGQYRATVGLYLTSSVNLSSSSTSPHGRCSPSVNLSSPSVQQRLVPCGLVDIDESSILTMKPLTPSLEPKQQQPPAAEDIGSAAHLAEAVGSSDRRPSPSLDQLRRMSLDRRTINLSFSDGRASSERYRRTPSRTLSRTASDSEMGSSGRRTLSARHVGLPAEGLATMAASPPPMGRSWFCRPCRQSCFAVHEFPSGRSGSPQTAAAAMEALKEVSMGSRSSTSATMVGGPKKGLTMAPCSPRTTSECSHFYTIL